VGREDAGVQPDELAACYPYLHHAAEGGSWPTIRRLGLLTTEQLVEACDLDPARREAVLGRRRPTSCRLEHPEHGTVVVRDQGPLRERHLDAALVGMTVSEWLHELNTRVFFWLHERRLATFLAAYRDRVHDVLVVDTAELVARHHDRVRLAAINTGATLFPNSAKRGRDTFRTIEDFPFDARRRTRQLHDNAVELAVTGGVPDVADLVLRVERRRGPDRTAVLWERDVR
jgi:hypothetical protein